MKLTELDAFRAAGFSVRTTNAQEMNPESAKIGALWGKFYAHLMPTLATNATIYGVYSKYESDYTGEFDVLAGSDALTENTDVDHCQIQAGKYLVFTQQGNMPQAVIDAWRAVWNYFATPNCPHQRAYRTDFEKYIGSDQVEIYIGVV